MDKRGKKRGAKTQQQQVPTRPPEAHTAKSEARESQTKRRIRERES
jgi:hypothetical protein